MAPIPEPALTDLLEAIKRRRCLPILGAGASVASNGYPGLNLGGTVAEHLHAELGRLGMGIDDIRNKWDLVEVSTHYELHRTRYELIKALRDELPHEKLQPLPSHVALARIPFPLIITTNYDTLLERALATSGRTNRVVIQPKEGFKDQTVPTSLFDVDEIAETVIYKIHGCFSQRNEDNIVVTADDYFTFLYRMPQKDLGMPSWISGRFAVNRLLFLGYSLEDWDFRVLHKAIDMLPRMMRPKSYAVRLKPNAFTRSYWKQRDVEILEHDVHDFVGQLAAEYQKRFGGTTP